MGSPPDEIPADPAPAPPVERPGRGRFRLQLDRDRKVGFSILFIAFCAALIVSWKAGEAVRPKVADSPAPPTAEGLAGFPERVDPMAALTLAHSLTEREQLRRILLQGVAMDGTVDVRDPQAIIRYEFDSAAGEGPEPPRPIGTVRQAHYCGRQSVLIRTHGIAAEPDQPRAMCRPSWGEPLPDPRCGPRELWQLALRRGARPDARANIDYYRAQEGPAWRFTLPGAQLHFTMYGDCEHELQGAGARPLVP
jgi:hypothetical protein